MTYIPATLRRLVEERANHRCEYGRTTVSLLQLNSDERIVERQQLLG